MSCSIVGIRWSNRSDLRPEPYVEVVEDVLKVRGRVEMLLFESRYNQLLLRFNDMMYVCEVSDFDHRKYCKTPIDYHPYQQYL